MVILFLFFLPAVSPAQMDSVSQALAIVDDFYSEANSSLKDFKAPEAVSIKQTTLLEKDQAIQELQSIGLTEKPSEKRFQQVRRVLDLYTESVISNVNGLGSKLGKPDKDRIDTIVKKLVSLKLTRMQEFEDTIRIETFERKTGKPAPLFNSPFNSPSPENPGMYVK